MSTIKVRFLRAASVETGITRASGEVADLPADTARHIIELGWAEQISSTAGTDATSLAPPTGRRAPTDTAIPKADQA